MNDLSLFGAMARQSFGSSRGFAYSFRALCTEASYFCSEFETAALGRQRSRLADTLPPRREGIMTVTVLVTNLPMAVVNHVFGFTLDGNLPTPLDGGRLLSMLGHDPAPNFVDPAIPVWVWYRVYFFVAHWLSPKER